MTARIACTALLAFLALPRFAWAMPSVTSDSDCPSASAVTAGLAGLLPADGPVSAVARIRTQGDHQVVELSSEDEPVGVRELPDQTDCEARAQAAVVIIAAWLDAMPAGILGPPELVARPAKPPGSTKTTAPLKGAGRPRIWLGLGVLAMLDATGLNAGATGELDVDRAIGRLGLAIALSAALARDVIVGQGSARWWRPALQVALRLPVVMGAWSLEASLGPIMGLVVLQGHGYDQNSSDVVVSWGAGAGLRSSWTLGHARLWIELDGRLWPERQRIRNQVQSPPMTRTADLPRWDGVLSLGFSLPVH